MNIFLEKIKKKVYVIAEAGVNHNGSTKLAIEHANIAKESGADAVKFQLFDINEQVSKIAANAPYQRKGTGQKSMLEMAKAYHLEWNNHLKIKKHCDKIGIDYLASCFDNNSVDFYFNEIKAEVIKISSGEITNLRLLDYIAKKNKSMLLSTGMATLDEVRLAVDRVKKHTPAKLILLHCTSNYPAENKELNLNAIKTIRKEFSLDVGYSDHSLGNYASVIAVSLGATIIEKHFTIDKSLPGPDHAMSLSPVELSDFIKAINLTQIILGNSEKKPTINEIDMIKIARRGIISTCKIKKGEKLTLNNTAIKRPAIGIDAKHYEEVIGKIFLTSVEENTPIDYNMIDI